MIMRTIVALSLLATCAMFGEDDAAKCGCGKPPVPREAAEVAGSVTTNQDCGCGKPPVTGREVTAPSTNQDCGCGKPPVPRDATAAVAAVATEQSCGCGKPPVTGREVTAPSTNQDANEKCPCGQPKPREGADVVLLPRDGAAVSQDQTANENQAAQTAKCCDNKAAHATMPCDDCAQKAANPAK